MIKVIYKELHNAKLFALETPVPIPSADEIKITILKYNPLNTNPKLAIVAQPVSIISSIPIIKSEKLPNHLMFDKN